MTLRDVNWVNGPMPVIDPDYLSQILASTADVAFLINPEGTVMSTLIDEGTAEQARYADWVGDPMVRHLTTESVPKFRAALEGISADSPMISGVELNHSDGGDWTYPVRYSFHRAGPGNAVLMLGHDLRLAAAAQEQLVQAQVALEQGFEARRAQDARYRVVLSGTSEPFVFLSATDGRITDLSVAAAGLFGRERDDLVGKPLEKELSHDGRGSLIDALNAASAERGDSIVEGTIGRSQRSVNIRPVSFRATGERMIYCRLIPSEDQSPREERLTETLRALYQNGPEAMLVCSTQGVIKDANDAFLELTDLPALSDARDRSLADFLQRGQVDLGVILEHVRRAGRLRMYSTRLTNEFGHDLVIDLSATMIESGGQQVIAIVIRDAERAEIIRRGVQPANQSEAPNQNVVELVGSATLKEIVAETNDVIEKICIETAVELTRNNRAAAAEMLGLSRQSLYVKLRKYGLQKSANDD